MGRQPRHSPSTERGVGAGLSHGPRVWSGNRQSGGLQPWRLSLALAAASLLLNPTATPAETSTCASDGTLGHGGAVDVTCCPSDLLSVYWPERSPQLSQTLCQLLVFPTTGLSNIDDFYPRIVDQSISSNSRQASAEHMTLPSLWWNRDLLTPQLGGRRLTESWISYQIKDSGTTVVDVMVNPQIWSVLTYNERFAVLNQFGTTARDFGYNLRFFQGNARNYRMVGLYACDFEPQSEGSLAAVVDPDTCSANLDAAQIVQLQRNLLAEGESRQQSPTAAVATDHSP